MAVEKINPNLFLVHTSIELTWMYVDQFKQLVFKRKPPVGADEAK